MPIQGQGVGRSWSRAGSCDRLSLEVPSPSQGAACSWEGCVRPLGRQPGLDLLGIRAPPLRGPLCQMMTRPGCGARVINSQDKFAESSPRACLSACLTSGGGRRGGPAAENRLWANTASPPLASVLGGPWASGRSLAGSGAGRKPWEGYGRFTKSLGAGGSDVEDRTNPGPGGLARGRRQRGRAVAPLPSLMEPTSPAPGCAHPRKRGSRPLQLPEWVECLLLCPHTVVHSSNKFKIKSFFRCWTPCW